MATATLTVNLPDDFPEEVVKRWGNAGLGVEEVDMLVPALTDPLVLLGSALQGFGEGGEHDSSRIGEALADARRAVQLLEAVADITAYVEGKDAKCREERELRAVG